jgi:hypothetical protein
MTHSPFLEHNALMEQLSTQIDAPTVSPPAVFPDAFPAELFAPVPGASLVVREQALRDRVDELQAWMLTQPQSETPVRNVFSGGVYARELFIPKGTLLIGKVHLTEHLNIFLKGDLTFLTVDGAQRIVAPTMFSAPAGTKKRAYANEDSIWINVHPAIHEDPEMIVTALTIDTYAEYDNLIERVSFQQMLDNFGLDADYVRRASEDETTLDRTPLPGVEVRESRIEGMGLFCTEAFSAGEPICPSLVGNKRTLAGRYSNHHPTPNCIVEETPDGYQLTALRDLTPGEELTTDYNATLSLILNRSALV